LIKLGDKVKDMITDFEGTAVARCVYLNGCVRCEIQPKGLDKDGKIVEAIWIDESQLIVLKETESQEKKEKNTGGPGSIPSKINIPH